MLLDHLEGRAHRTHDQRTYATAGFVEQNKLILRD